MNDVVTNITDLTLVMRKALLDEHGSRQTLQALERRGLVQNVPTHSIRGHFTAFLTEAGNRVRMQLEQRRDDREAELARVSITPEAVITPPLPPVDENLLRFHTHGPVCGDHAYAYGSLAHVVERVLQRDDVGPESAADLRAYLAQTARCLIRTRDVDTTDDLTIWAGE